MMSFAILAIVKATLVCGVAFFLARLCRRARASIRHLLFGLAFIALVVIPGVTTRVCVRTMQGVRRPPIEAGEVKCR